VKYLFRHVFQYTDLDLNEIYEMFIRGIYKSGAKKCGTQMNIRLNKVQILIKKYNDTYLGGED